MPKRKPDYPILGLLSCINTLGYGTLAHIFFNKLIASRDFEVMGFPITLASDPFTRMVILYLGTAIATGSSIVIPTALAWAGVHYNEYFQRRLNQMPEKEHKQKNPRNVRKFRKRKSKPDNNSDETPDIWNKDG